MKDYNAHGLPTPEAAEQLRLPLCKPPTPPEVVAVRSIDFGILDLSGHRARQLRELLIAVIFCGLRDGCQAHVDALMRVANENSDPANPPFGSAKTYYRVEAIAIEHCLLKREQQGNGRGQTQSLRMVNMRRVNKLVNATRRKRRESDRHLTNTWETPDRHKPISTNRTKGSTRCAVEEKTEWTAAEVDRVRTKCNALLRRLGRNANELELADRELLAKSAWLALTLPGGERWIDDAVEGCINGECRRRNVWAYLHETLKTNASESGRYFHQELARIRLPPELAKRQPRQAPRLCSNDPPP